MRKSQVERYKDLGIGDKRINIETERAAFEAKFPDAVSYRWGIHGYADKYGLIFEGWLAARATPPATGETELPRWIDDQKGKDPLIDDLIAYIIAQQAAIAHYLRKQAGQGSTALQVEAASNTMLWLYRRLPRAYGRPMFVEASIKQISSLSAMQLDECFAERGAGQEGEQPTINKGETND